MWDVYYKAAIKTKLIKWYLIERYKIFNAKLMSLSGCINEYDKYKI